MLQPREGSRRRYLQTEQTQRWKMPTKHYHNTSLKFPKSSMLQFSIISLLILLPFGLTQFIDKPYIVEPTPALRLGEEDLTTVLLVNNDLNSNNFNGPQALDYHARFLSVRPEVGLLTSTARTFIQEGVTTEYSTQVVGTTLDNGRYYAQYLKKSSRVLYEQPPLATAATPSVVTSWVGETLQHAGSVLPQSHNDLYNAAEQADWQDIDDRILGDQHGGTFISNTDFVGGFNGKHVSASSALSDSGGTSSASSSAASDSGTAAAIRVNPSIKLAQVADKVAAHKVQPIGDLPTYTVKNYFAPSGYAWDADNTQSLSSEQRRNASTFANLGSSGRLTTKDRTPKLYYKQLLSDQRSYRNGVVHQQAALPVAAANRLTSPVLNFASRVLATTTYYGFADFTTVVGDSVIVFTPSSATAQLPAHLLGYVTSIKGEATLGGSANKTQASNAYISITEASVAATQLKAQLQASQTPQAAHPVAATRIEDLQQQQATAVVVAQQQTPTEVYEDGGNKTNMPLAEAVLPQVPVQTPQLEASEMSALPASVDYGSDTSKRLATSASVLPTTPMLSRPSDEEIRRIYAALSAAAAAGKETLASSIETTVSQAALGLSGGEVVAAAPTAMEAIAEQPKLATLPILGGATTIFFEEDPFGNFVAPSAVTAAATTTTTDTTTAKTTTSSNIAPKSSNSADEATTVSVPQDETTLAPETTATTTTTTEAHTTYKADNSESAQPTELPPVATELTAASERHDPDSSCLSRTSQVFLTQVPRTLTSYTTHLESALGSESTSIEANIVPSYDIAQATKYYCIQATGVVQIDNVLVGSVVTMDAPQLEQPELHENTLEEGQQATTEANNVQELLGVEPVTEGIYELEPTTELANKSELAEEGATEPEDELEELVEDADELAEGDEEEIELIYKTLYTTYTYLTTFFHDDTTSISSHTELVTNVITSTLGMAEEQASVGGFAELAHELAPTASSGQEASPTTKYMVTNDLENIIREGDEHLDEPFGEFGEKAETPAVDISSTPSLELQTESLLRKTYYTTYTYYTTIFVDGDTEIMSRTEIFTNFKTATLMSPMLVQSSSVTEEPTVMSTATNTSGNVAATASSSYSTVIRQPASQVSSDLAQYAAVTLVTDVRSSSSSGAQHIINNAIVAPPVAAVARSHNEAFGTASVDDQISSESNNDEILPSATLLLQTSFTTFTYYTTMYSGDSTNVASRLDTITNVVTETLQNTKTVNLDESTLPVTYFTTFTYWTKLAKDGDITTLSREETISNVVTPTIVASISSSMLPALRSNDEAAAAVVDKPLPVYKPNSNGSTAASAASGMPSVATSTLEPTTYFTTYTYYTTSYEAERTIIDSRFETITQAVTPTVTLTTYLPQTAEQPEIVGALGVLQTGGAIGAPTLLYDYKQIIDADGISTLYVTTAVVATTGADGVLGESVSSSSSWHVDELKQALLPAATASATATTTKTVTGNDAGVTLTVTNVLPQRQYKVGLVRLIEGTRIGNRTTTLYQSKVIGTIIDNRYAQIIESTSSFLLDKTQLPQDLADISATHTLDQQQYTLHAITPTGVVQSSIGNELEHTEASTETTLALDEELPDEEGESDHAGSRASAPNKKRTFTPIIRPFVSRNRPQFAPKKKNVAPSSATIITRSDFTPTITATPALKSTAGGRFSSSRRGGAASTQLAGSNSGSAFGSSTARRFGRPSRTSTLGGGGSSNTPAPGATATANLGGFGAARNRLSNSRLSPTGSSGRRTLASFQRPSATGGFRPGLSSVYAGSNSRRIKPTAALGISGATEATITAAPDSSAEEESSTQELPAADGGDDEAATESSRRNQNPLLRLRRPLNRPSGFTPAAARPRNAANETGSGGGSAISTRRNPLAARAKASTATTTTTTTTARPRPRSFQRPTIASFQNRERPQSSLFPPRGLFQANRGAAGQPDAGTEQKKQEDGAAGGGGNEADDNNSEYDDDEEDEDDTEEDVNRRRRSNGKPKTASWRVRRAAVETPSGGGRANFRNRYRRPKLAAERSFYDDETTEHETTTTTTARTRIGSRFNARYHHTSSTGAATSATTDGRSNSNYRAIRPTRPISGRAQFTLREKDTTTKGYMRGGSGKSNFRRPPTAASARRAGGGVSSNNSSNRRLKNYAGNNSNNNNNAASAGSAEGNARSAGTRSRAGSSTPSARGRNNNRGRSRGNDYNADQYHVAAHDGTITVTHVIPAEVSIPVVNGKLTEYRNVVTGKTSTEVLGPQQWTSFVGSNGQLTTALTRQDSSVNFAGVTEITQFILHDSATTTVTFTPTTIRGRKTSFSHIIPSTVYSVEQVVSTEQPQISANAPLANILLSQLLLGNIGLPGGNPLLVTTVPGLGGLPAGIPGTAGGQAAGLQPTQAMPVTEYRTHASTYVTTLVEGMSTIVPVTFQGKKILTTVYDTTAQTITATEFITDTIVTTPTLQQQQQPAAAAQVNSLLLQQLLLQQQQLQQAQPQLPLGLAEPILQSAAPQLLYSDPLQELDTNNIRLSHEHEKLDDIGALVDGASAHKSSGRKKSGRKSGKSHKRNKMQQPQAAQESSIITLYVSGRRPGEFSTILSTVYNSGGGYESSTLHKRQVSSAAIVSVLPTRKDYASDYYDSDYYASEGSELMSVVVAASQQMPQEHELELELESAPLEQLAAQFDAAAPAVIDNFLSDNDAEAAVDRPFDEAGTAKVTQALETIVGDVGLWYAKSMQHVAGEQQLRATSRHAYADKLSEATNNRRYFFV